jgi:hypothetical protein
MIRKIQPVRQPIRIQIKCKSYNITTFSTFLNSNSILNQGPDWKQASGSASGFICYPRKTKPFIITYY